RAIEADAYFSVNAAMAEDQIRLLPPERVLCETDFPARKIRARKPADTQRIELLLSRVWNETPEDVRARTWWNLRSLSEQSGAITRRPEPIADTLLFLQARDVPVTSHEVRLGGLPLIANDPADHAEPLPNRSDGSEPCPPRTSHARQRVRASLRPRIAGPSPR